MNERMRFNPAEAAAAGEADAHSLLKAIRHTKDGNNLASRLNDSLAEIIGLAVDNRIEECTARLESFCAAVGPALYPAGRTAADRLRIQPVLNELKAAGQIIRNALAVMTLEQKVEWGHLNERDGVDGEGITRANERSLAIVTASNETESEGGEL